MLCFQALCLLNLLLCDLCQDLQPKGSVPADGTDNCAYRDPFHTICGGNNDAFNIFNDIPTTRCDNPLWKCPEDLTCLCRCKGNRNWLRASQCRDKFTFQYFGKSIENGIRHFIVYLFITLCVLTDTKCFCRYYYIPYIKNLQDNFQYFQKIIIFYRKNENMLTSSD